MEKSTTVWKRRWSVAAGLATGLLLLLLAWLSHGSTLRSESLGGQNAGELSSKDFSYADYARVLSDNVNAQGFVNYRHLQAHREDLDGFISELGRLDPKGYQHFPEAQKIALWINAYNALTLKLIIDHYPIQSSFFKSLLYPKNSIRQIPGAWVDFRFTVMGKDFSLDQIEHEVLRKRFHEPRIHMALVCAAHGCPPLRTEPYRGAELDRQLNDQTRRFLEDPHKFRLDRKNKKVYLSPIFKWFGEDFIQKYSAGDRFRDHSKTERAVLNFIVPFLSRPDQQFLDSERFQIDYLDYDWTLNVQQ